MRLEAAESCGGGSDESLLEGKITLNISSRASYSGCGHQTLHTKSGKSLCTQSKYCSTVGQKKMQKIYKMATTSCFISKTTLNKFQNNYSVSESVLNAA